MNSDPKSKFRLPFGETEWFHVSRDVAQRADESPWLYSCFINGLAEDLKASSLGLRIAGIHTPLLMYADDIVLLASSVQELREMNTIVSNYAHRNRYTLNGDKSAVMVFNASDSLLNIEDLTHFILFCKGYHKHRTSLFSALGQFLRIESLDYVSTMDLLLGASTGSAFADDRIDFLFKRFLKKSWRTRKWLTIATNSLFNRSDTAWALKCHGDDQQITL